MSSTAPALAPARDAPEILHRLLALIDSLHQPQDLTIERVAQFSGLPMRRIDMPGDYFYKAFQNLTDAWSYRYTWGLNDATHLPDLGFSFTKD